jgi:hypothetical protein
VVGYNGHEPTWELQASVNRDLQRISECGQHYPHDYGGNWLENRLNYGISFTRSVDDHGSKLATRLELQHACGWERALIHLLSSLRSKETIDNEAMGLDDITVTSVGVDQRHNVVRVGVRPEHPDVRQRLRDNNGPTVRIEDSAIATMS